MGKGLQKVAEITGGVIVKDKGGNATKYVYDYRRKKAVKESEMTAERRKLSAIAKGR